MSAPQQRRTRRPGTWALSWALLAALLTTCYLFYPEHNEDEAFFKTLLDTQVPYKADAQNQGGWNFCDAYDIVHGTWESNRDFTDLQGVFDAYQLKVSIPAVASLSAINNTHVNVVLAGGCQHKV